jgi:hypothetical protein
VVLDFGKDIGGFTTVSFGKVSDANQQVGLAYSESTNYAYCDQDVPYSSAGSDCVAGTGAIPLNFRRCVRVCVLACVCVCGGGGRCFLPPLPIHPSRPDPPPPPPPLTTIAVNTPPLHQKDKGKREPVTTATVGRVKTGT